jgi:hypothetical protein
VDFLCGEFNWKERFHLATRPLYRLQKSRNVESWPLEPDFNGREVCAA